MQMTEKPRITLQFQMGPDGTACGAELFVNPAGRALLMDSLNSLSESDDHFHLFSEEWQPDGDLSIVPYDKDATVGHHLKVLFRPDKWDREYFPHLFVDLEADNKT
jgi:hypothetical protein